MSKMTLAWIESQIEQEIERGNVPGAVRDLAALLTVRDHLSGFTFTGNLLMAAAAMQQREAPSMRDSNTITIRDYQDNRGAEKKSTDEHLTRAEAESWVRGMVDNDGHRGGRWTLAEIKQYAGNFGVTGTEDVIDFFAAMNAMATDYGEVAKAHGVDNVDFYADMAKAFLHDRDAVQGKIKRYYEDIAKA